MLGLGEAGKWNAHCDALILEPRPDAGRRGLYFLYVTLQTLANSGKASQKGTGCDL